METLVARIAALQDKSNFKELHWEGSFEEYLRMVRENPRIARTAFQRLHDMIVSHGKTEYIDNKKKLIRYHFFHDEEFGGRDAVFGLDVPLMKLVNVFKSAAEGYGTEKRVILLHGPVGSSKSTIVRLLKKGIEEYSRTPEGALYTFNWILDKKREDGTVFKEVYPTPMNEDPLLLIPQDLREKAFAELSPPDAAYTIAVKGDLCPASRLIFNELMTEYKGDLVKVLSHVRVKRLAPLGKGSHRHWHLPAEGREESGLDRADRRCELPEDRRVRQRLRPARVQLRRRVQYRQPRRGGIHRGAETRRRLLV